MGPDFRETARHLWQTAPWWRYSAIGAGAFGGLFLINVASGIIFSGDAPPPPAYAPPTPSSVPEPPPDPASEAHLQAYESAYKAAAGLPSGKRCELLADALGRLEPEDIRAGRNVRSSSASRIRALSDGRQCQADLGTSDRRFDDLAKAVLVAVSGPTASALAAVQASYSALTEFDRFRSRYERDSATIRQAQDLLKADADSQARIAALTQAEGSLQDNQTPADYMRVAAALRALTDGDRVRLTPDQQPLLGTADRAAEKVGESRSRIGKVTGLLETMGDNPNPDTAQPLIDAVAALTPFDKALATTQQKALIAKAEAVATPLAWSSLGKALATLNADKSIRNYSAVSRIYGLLAANPAPKTPDQQHLFNEAQQAAEFIPASDARLRSMQQAAESWRQTGLQARDAVLAALKNTMKFDLDRARFDDTMTADWDLLKRASVILLGPQMGLTMSDRDRLPVFVFTHGEGRYDRQFINTLDNELSAAGYLVTGKHDDAALLAEVSVQAVSDPTIDTSNQVATYRSTAQIDVATRWASDDSLLFSNHFEASANASSQDVKIKALFAGIGQIVDRFRQVTTR